ncbi:protein seele isoform X4 [Phalaenopsis equestris]|uniref:protein seele isoform X4 n=1 Tax=Phalaenopsis equestris TaxID=78828 RepID=UPI0009E493C8|nr:protein seele isoform X4 [Phalaenopsis equestris]
MLVGDMEDRDSKRKRKNPRSVLWLALILANLSLGFTMGDKCSSCNTIADEIQIGISNEKPRNHLDMRHRLDSKGQREGKLIDYRVSELRVVELLDGLCEKMQDYTLEKLDTGEEIWTKVNDWDNFPSDKQEARAYSKYISFFCARLLEETEDELAELLKKGDFKPGELRKQLCQNLSKHCVTDSVDDDFVEDEL